MAVKTKPHELEQDELEKDELEKDELEKDIIEFSSLLAATLKALKSAGPPPDDLHDAIANAELGDRHRPALLAVALGGPLSVSDLAKRLGLGLSTTSTIVGQLDRAGLVHRSEDDADRRRTIVRVHDDHREAMEAWLEQALAPIRATLAQLTPAGRRHFMEGWRILHAQATLRATGTGVDHCVD
jgi:DNA-binding MarR family transcriptional regulator